jgi:hypothetical protein
MLLTGLTPKQFQHLGLLISTKYSELGTKNRYVKYLYSSYDNRTKSFFYIGLSGQFGEYKFYHNIWVMKTPPKDWKYTNMYEWIIDFLEKKWEPSEEIYKLMQ